MGNIDISQIHIMYFCMIESWSDVCRHTRGRPRNNKPSRTRIRARINVNYNSIGNPSISQAGTSARSKSLFARYFITKDFQESFQAAKRERWLSGSHLNCIVSFGAAPSPRTDLSRTNLWLSSNFTPSSGAAAATINFETISHLLWPADRGIYLHYRLVWNRKS